MGLQVKASHGKLTTMPEPKVFEQMCRRVHGLTEVMLAIVKLCHEQQYGTVEVHIHEGAIKRHYVETVHVTPK